MQRVQIIMRSNLCTGGVKHGTIVFTVNAIPVSSSKEETGSIVDSRFLRTGLQKRNAGLLASWVLLLSLLV